MAGAHLVKFSENSPQKGGLVHQKVGRSKGKRGSCQMYDTERPYQVFLWYRLGKYQENTNQYHTEIPNRDTTLVTLELFYVQPGNLNTSSLASGYRLELCYRSGGARQKVPLSGWYFDLPLYVTFDCAGIAAFQKHHWNAHIQAY